MSTGPPPFLRRLKRKHIACRPIWEAQRRLMGDSISDEEEELNTNQCWICKDASPAGVVIPISHAQEDSECRCLVHEDCLSRWQDMHERKCKSKMRVRTCPACRGKRARCTQPMTKTPVLCGTPLADGRVCSRSIGHLGLCA